MNSFSNLFPDHGSNPSFTVTALTTAHAGSGSDLDAVYGAHAKRVADCLKNFRAGYRFTAADNFTIIWIHSHQCGLLFPGYIMETKDAPSNRIKGRIDFQSFFFLNQFYNPSRDGKCAGETRTLDSYQINDSRDLGRPINQEILDCPGFRINPFRPGTGKGPDIVFPLHMRKHPGS